jgi:indole-3-glycerol phosphate synthase
LLIVRILDNAQLVDLIAAARDLKFATLVEAHDRVEVERALKAGADIIGINNRDLARFEVNHELAPHMAQGVPPDIVLVAESGVRSSEDVARIGEAGIDAVLVGETLMRAPDPRRLVLELSSQPRARRQ